MMELNLARIAGRPIRGHVLAGCLLILFHPGVSRMASASEGFDTLVQVIKSGADDKTFRDYVNASPQTYALTVDEILYLSDLGLSAETIKVITEHGQSTNGMAPIAETSGTNFEASQDQVGAESEPVGMEPVADTPVVAPAAQEVVQETVTAPPVITAPPTDAVDYSTFYGGLAPYGNWLNIEGTWCWQPTAMMVDASWSPYCQRGRWVYSDCGWAWESSYSWGWAPFHYGRWRHHSRHGWIWYPGRVWGPAWVCWRYSDSTIGWAPLPPDVTFETSIGLCYQGRAVPATFDCGLSWGVYTFVPVSRFCERGVARHRFPHSRIEPMFHQPMVLQTRVVAQEGRICNFGPPATHIASATHQEIHAVRIMDHTIRAGDPIPRSKVSATTLSVYRPPVSPTARENPRQIVIRHETHERENREASRRDNVFRLERSPSTLRSETTRGRESRTAPHTTVTPALSIPPDTRQREQLHQAEQVTRQRQAEEAAARHRQADEAAARQQEAQRRRAEDLIRQQNSERQRAQEEARQRTLAEQQHRQAEFAAQQEQRRRAEETARQQESQRRQQDMLRQQALRNEAEAQARVADLQRQALRNQREAEEQMTRRQDAQARAQQAAVSSRQPEVHVAQPVSPQGYGNPATTQASSNRGASSRNTRDDAGHSGTHRW